MIWQVGAYHEIEEKFKPPMRLFVVYPDHTGSELMNRQRCQALFDSPSKNSEIVQVVEDVNTDDLAKG